MGSTTDLALHLAQSVKVWNGCAALADFGMCIRKAICFTVSCDSYGNGADHGCQGKRNSHSTFPLHAPVYYMSLGCSDVD